MSSTGTARSSAPSSPSQRYYKGSHTTYYGALPPGNAPAWQRGPTKSYYRQVNEVVPKAKGGKPLHHKRQNNDHPEHNVLLHRLSLPSPSPSGALLERIGESVEDVDEVASTLTDSDRIDGERVSEGADSYTNMPASSIPHYYTPEPGEVERFLESVIGAPPAPPSPPPPDPGPVHACLVCCPHLVRDTPLLFT